MRDSAEPRGRPHARTAGGPPAVLLLPGLAVIEYVEPTQRALAARGLGSALLDLPGFGRSRSPARPLDLVEHADAAADWLAARGGGPLTVLGHSIGTQIAAHLAARAPWAVRCLVLVGPTVDPSARSLPRLAGRWLVDGTREPRGLTRSQVPEWLHAGPRTLAATLRAARSDRLERTLASVRSPVVVARGERDPIATAGWARELAALSGGRYAEVAGAPHSVPFSHPDALADLVVEANAC